MNDLEVLHIVKKVPPVGVLLRQAGIPPNIGCYCAKCVNGVLRNSCINI